jgi:hypothetical protein
MRNRLAIVVSVLNLLLLVVLLTQNRGASAQGNTEVLRGRGLELVDGSGHVRAQFTIEADGEAVFRLRDSSGAIRVKLGAGSNGSGLVLMDEATEPGVQILSRRSATPARPTTTSITLTGADGQRRTIVP